MKTLICALLICSVNSMASGLCFNFTAKPGQSMNPAGPNKIGLVGFSFQGRAIHAKKICLTSVSPGMNNSKSVRLTNIDFIENDGYSAMSIDTWKEVPANCQGFEYCVKLVGVNGNSMSRGLLPNEAASVQLTIKAFKAHPGILNGTLRDETNGIDYLITGGKVEQ